MFDGNRGRSTLPLSFVEGDDNAMKEPQRDFKIGIKNNKEFFAELKELADRIDDGWLPDRPIERLYFDDLPSLLNMVKSATPEA